jgi:peptide deformylase
MIHPIVAFGEPKLKKRSEDIEPGSIDIKTLIDDMFETMYNAQGVGLAAPQIGKNIRVFVIDSGPMEEDESTDAEEPEERNISNQKVFINPLILEEEGIPWAFEEGCLSIPGIREEISRKPKIKIRYLDQNFKEQVETFEGIQARIIQHEYDHLEGILFTDRISVIKKRLLKSKLTNISKGNIPVEYRMKFPDQK